MSATTVVNAPQHVYEIYIRTTPEKLWEAITRPEMTRQYYYGLAVASEWKPGAPVRYQRPDGQVNLDGKILEIVPQRRLVTTFAALFAPGAGNDRPSRVTYEIEPRGEVCKLTLIHDDFDGITATYQAVGSGWNGILSGLKTLLETGKPLAIPPGAQ